MSHENCKDPRVGRVEHNPRCSVMTAHMYSLCRNGHLRARSKRGRLKRYRKKFRVPLIWKLIWMSRLRSSTTVDLTVRNKSSKSRKKYFVRLPIPPVVHCGMTLKFYCSLMTKVGRMWERSIVVLRVNPRGLVVRVGILRRVGPKMVSGILRTAV